MTVLGILLILCLLPTAPAQNNNVTFRSSQRDTRLPNGKSRTIAIVKNDFEKTKRDIAEMIKLAEEFQKQLEGDTEFVVDLRSVRRAEKIERLGRRIKKRLVRLR